MSVAGSLSTVDQRGRAAADAEAGDSDLSARPLPLVSQGDERLGAGHRPDHREVPAHASSPSSSTTRSRRRASTRARSRTRRRRTVTLRLIKAAGAVPVLADGRAVLRGPAVRGRGRQGQRHARVGLEVLPPRDARDRYADGRRPPRAGTRWRRRHRVLRHRLREDRLAADGVQRPAERAGAGRRRRRPTAGAPPTCTR